MTSIGHDRSNVEDLTGTLKALQALQAFHRRIGAGA
jgi:hypothetical protein